MLAAVILVLVVLFIVVKTFGHATQPLRTRPDRPHSSNRSFRKQVHGIFHENDDGTSRQKIIRGCTGGEELQLVPEPNNPVDPGAVKICRMNGEQIGYWPADGGRLAGDLAIGWTYHTTIDEIYELDGDSRKRGVCMRVEVLTMAHGKPPRKLAQ